MSNFFKRLSLTLDNSTSSNSNASAGGTRSEYQDASKGSNKALSSAVSFNDFSMHVMTDGDHYVTSSGYLDDVVDGKEGLSVSGMGLPRHSASIPIKRARADGVHSTAPSVKVEHGSTASKSVPTASTPSSPTSYESLPLVMPRGMNLKIHPGAAAGSSVAASLMGTPKRYLVDAEGTPRSSLDLCETSSLPTPRASLCCEEVPSSPTSPTSPGSIARKKKHSKIHGMDYYEFCELVRAGSL